MGQQLQSWRSAGGERLWLSMLVEAMEQAAGPEFRAIPCDQAILIAVGVQLARPATPPCRFGASNFSFRNQLP